jgi:opacity protein-like surface antigen
MIQKKLLLATTAGLVVASFPLFAAQVVSSSTNADVKTTSQANVQAENAGTTVSSAIHSQNKPALAVVSSPRQSSFYAGLGIAMLNDKGFTGLMPKVMLGYGLFYGKDRNFYTALEIGGGAGSILLSGDNQHFRVSNFFNASIIPGYMIYDEVMLYARLGGQATRYSKLNSTKNGGVYGIGLEINNSQNWDTRFEYNYANNKNLNQYIVDVIYKFR